jgi:hypothetical protein
VLPTHAEAPDWEIEREEIASTPEMRRTVSELLNYDDAVFVNYVRGSDRISIYIAYWKPGKMSHRLVAGHTPDICWIAAGWNRIDAHAATALSDSSGIRVLPPEQRLMERNGAREWVLFWHLVGHEILSYGAALPPWHASLTEMATKGLNQRDEQFFIRISSARPPSYWWDSNVVKALLRRLAARNVPI